MLSLRRRLSTTHLAVLASLVIVLNLLDAIWTLTFVEAGIAEEANPLMASALGHGPLSFMIAKLTLVSLCVLLLWRLRHRAGAAIALWSGVLTYTLVVAYHFSNAHYLVLAAR
jgi:hypothetical protein